MRAETRRTERRGPVRRGPIPTLSEPEEFLHALESVSRGVGDPVAKLRFIRTSLSRYQTLDRAVRAVPSASLRRLLYRWLSLEGLHHLLDTSPLVPPPPPSTSPPPSRWASARPRWAGWASTSALPPG